MTIQITNTISIQDACALVLACPRVTYSFTGAPGGGKTFAPAMIFREAGYRTMVANVQNMPIEDTAQVPVVDPVTKALTFAPNEMWRPRGDKLAIIIDELPKAPEDVFNAFIPLLYGKPRTFMGFEYPEDTIVVVTGNSAFFNAGDNMRPHHVNRMVNLNIADPTRETALAVMTKLGYDARVIEWVQIVPRALCSYDPAMQKAKSDKLQSYFGFVEAAPASPFCSMRSLEMASDVLKTSSKLPPDVLRAALVGSIGVNAALSLLMFAEGIAEFVSPDDIVNSPLTAKVPASPFDQHLAGTTAAAIVDKSNYNAVLKYVDRLHKDVADNIFTARLVHKSPEVRIIPAIAKRMAAVL